MSDTNWPMHLWKARIMKFWLYVKEELYYPISENKDADQLPSYCEADLHFVFSKAIIQFSHDAAQLA